MLSLSRVYVRVAYDGRLSCQADNGADVGSISLPGAAVADTSRDHNVPHYLGAWPCAHTRT